MSYDRADRLAGIIYQVVQEALTTEISDPRLAGVRVTKVNVTRDLRTARVNFHVGGSDDDKRKHALKGFRSARGFLKKCIGQAVELRFMPEIEFFYDDAVDSEDRVGELLDQIRQE